MLAAPMPRSLLDEAHAARDAGDHDAALRAAIALLEEDPGQLGAADLLADVLIEHDRVFVASEVALRLVDAFVRRGDLPRAVVAAKTAEMAGEDGDALRLSVASAFGKGSKRLADLAPVPPPLPPEVKVGGALAKLSGDALLDRGESALQKYLATDDDVPADRDVPELPLFADMPPKALADFLGALEIRHVPPKSEVIEQGEDGVEAYVMARGLCKVVRHDGDEEVVLAGLGPGAIFGEMALVSESPRAAAVVATESCTLLVVTRETLESVAQKVKVVGQALASFCRQRMLSNLVRHSAILGAVDTDERMDLVQRFETEHFEVGDALLTEGEEGRGLFLIASGLVEVVGEDGDGDELRIATLGPGDVVGEISLVLRRPANATVRALHPTVALSLARDQFHEAIKQHPELLGELYQTATEREEETKTVVAQEALDVEDIVLL